MKFFLKSNLFFIFIALLFCVSAQVFALGNTITLDVPSAPVAPESEFSVGVFINTQDSINAFDIEIAYPKDKLKFISSNNINSIVDIWQTTPAILPNGNIHLIGGISKSFTGDKGLLLNIVFKATVVGDGSLSFAKSNLYIADGKATNAIVGILPSVFSIKEGGLDTPSRETLIDTTLPEIVLEQTKSPINGATLITFQVSDKDFGIKKIQMRYRKYFTFSSWQDVQNPVLSPVGAWSFELRAYSTGGAERIKSIILYSELCKKILAVIVLLFVLILIVKRVYNKKKTT